jgi:hypothetical protein
MKRISLLLVVVLTMFGSIDAFACAHCTISHNPPYDDICVTRAAGGVYCEFYGSPAFCEEIGICGGGVAPLETALASQWTVASVERLDEPRQSTNAVKAAHLASKPTHKR